MRLKNKVCLISGATGIAAATAELAAREGASVFIVSISEDQCRAVTERLGAPHGYAAADLTGAPAVEGAVLACVSRFGRVDGLFNVAGMSGRRFGDGPWHECSEEGWDKTIEVNLKTMFLLTRAVLRQMLGQPVADSGIRGSILNMGSVTAFSPQRDYFATHAYAAAKGAVEAMTIGAAAYYMPHKIRFNAVAPGLVRTPMSARAQGNEEILRFMKEKQQPLSDGILEAGEIAKSAVFLLSDESRHITGQVLAVDGGWRVS